MKFFLPFNKLLHIKLTDFTSSFFLNEKLESFKATNKTLMLLNNRLDAALNKL